MVSFVSFLSWFTRKLNAETTRDVGLSTNESRNVLKTLCVCERLDGQEGGGDKDPMYSIAAPVQTPIPTPSKVAGALCSSPKGDFGFFSFGRACFFFLSLSLFISSSSSPFHSFYFACGLYCNSKPSAAHLVRSVRCFVFLGGPTNPADWEKQESVLLSRRQ